MNTRVRWWRRVVRGFEAVMIVVTTLNILAAMGMNGGVWQVASVFLLGLLSVGAAEVHLYAFDNYLRSKRVVASLEEVQRSLEEVQRSLEDMQKRLGGR